MPSTPSATHDFSAVVVKPSSAVLPALMAVALGLFMVGVVGFSHSDILHNAAHDVRHANGFPCH